MNATIARLPAWATAAACTPVVATGDDPWNPEGSRAHVRREHDRARTICATCPVLTRCRRWAIATAEPHGVWGGLTPAMRREVAELLGLPRPGAAEHGTRARYVRGCRCRPCTTAHARYTAHNRAQRRHRPAPDTPGPTIAA